MISVQFDKKKGALIALIALILVLMHYKSYVFIFI